MGVTREIFQGGGYGGGPQEKFLALFQEPRRNLVRTNRTVGFELLYSSTYITFSEAQNVYVITDITVAWIGYVTEV